MKFIIAVIILVVMFETVLWSFRFYRLYKKEKSK